MRCKKCSEVLDLDPIDGFLICTWCGLVADEGTAWLQHQELGGAMDENEKFANVDGGGNPKGDRYPVVKFSCAFDTGVWGTWHTWSHSGIEN